MYPFKVLKDVIGWLLSTFEFLAVLTLFFWLSLVLSLVEWKKERQS